MWSNLSAMLSFSQSARSYRASVCHVQEKNLNPQDKDVCIGPLIKYTVFDAFFGALCGILLIVGSLQKSLVRTSTLLFNEHFIPQLQTT